MKNNYIKYFLVVCISIILILTTTTPFVLSDTNVEKQNPNQPSDKATHTVLGEEGTGTWCYWCQFVIPILDAIYSAGSHDFYYVALVEDMNTYAHNRCVELGITGYPTMFYDGGYQTIVGGGASQSEHETVISICEARTDVADVDLDLTISWLGNSQIGVQVSVTNNEGSAYNGHLHVYITEKDSRWDHYTGLQYHFAMIGNYGLNQNVNVGAGATETYSSTWTSPYTDITMSNIKGIAAVFDSSTDYVDECTAADPLPPNSDPPSTPTTPSGPDTGYVGIPYTFSTSSTEPNSDNIRYGWDWNGDGTVDDWSEYYGSGETAYIDHSFDTATTYNVKVKAQDVFNDESSFSPTKTVTISTGDPPLTPSTPNGETNGMHNIEYTYTSSTTDTTPGDQLYYLFDWGDSTDSDWTGPFDSGDTASAAHTWPNMGSYDVKVKAKDLADQETAWSDVLTVIIGNSPPNTPPHPAGPSTGDTGKEYEYTAYTTDPEDDDLEYLFDWGDGTQSAWNPEGSAMKSWELEGTYEVKVKARDNWEESGWSAPKEVVIENYVTADAGGPYNGFVGTEINFYGSASNGVEPYSFVWDFGDGDSGTGPNPTHVYDSEGDFFVILTVTDGVGKSDDDSAYAYIAGADSLIPDAGGPYQGAVNTEVSFQGSVLGGQGPYSYEWDFGDGDTGSGQNPTHTYSSTGEFEVSLTVTDSEDREGTDTTIATIIENAAPEIPTITGTINGSAGESYVYTISTTDPDGNQVSYYVEWGDATNSGWIGPSNSNEAITMSHSWEDEDTYIVRVKAKDTYDVESDWATLEVSMPISHGRDGFLWLLELLMQRFPLLEFLIQVLFI
jgi:PKD repeat protein